MRRRFARAGGRPARVRPLRILQTSPEGGAFDQQLQMFPLFTFTRLSDGATRTFDAGQVPPTPQFFQGVILSSDNQPWRAGCVPPALVVPGLNDGFCPGLTPDGAVKQLNVRQSRLIKHSVYPAQPQLEHFSCYLTRPLGRFKGRRVRLADQFGTSQARVVDQRGLCVPVRKNREPFSNRRAHLQCYGTRLSPPFRARNVAIRNQFGPAVLRLRGPTALCVPSLKTAARRRQAPPLRAAERIDHFTCYRASSRAALPRRQVTLAGQFGRDQVRVLRPFSLCAPASKNRERAEHPVRHLVCYATRPVGRRTGAVAAAPRPRDQPVRLAPGLRPHARGALRAVREKTALGPVS